MSSKFAILLPLREKVACGAGRMRGRTGLSGEALKLVGKRLSTPHPSAFGRHLLPQGEKEIRGRT
jgi:hypothetical protein